MGREERYALENKRRGTRPAEGNATFPFSFFEPLVVPALSVMIVSLFAEAAAASNNLPNADRLVV